MSGSRYRRSDHCGDYKGAIDRNIIYCKPCVANVIWWEKSCDFHWAQVTSAAAVCRLHSWTLNFTCHIFLIKVLFSHQRYKSWCPPLDPGRFKEARWNSRLGKTPGVAHCLWLCAFLSLLMPMASLPQQLLWFLLSASGCRVGSERLPVSGKRKLSVLWAGSCHPNKDMSEFQSSVPQKVTHLEMGSLQG